MANFAEVTVSWVLSPSTDVVEQNIHWELRDALGAVVLEGNDVLGPAVDTYLIANQLPEKHVLFVSHTVSDGTNTSTALTGSLDIGDLNAPLPATGLAFSVNVVAVPDPV